VIAKLLGLAPLNRDSGMLRGRRTICLDSAITLAMKAILGSGLYVRLLGVLAPKYQTALFCSGSAVAQSPGDAVKEKNASYKELARPLDGMHAPVPTH
jgi:hypothetical protein